MLVRRPVAEVFAVFTDPQVTTKCWFIHAGGALAPGAEVEWCWGMYDVGPTVRVVEFEPERRIAIDWIDQIGARTRVEWRFQPRAAAASFVDIIHNGLAGDSLEQAAQACDSTEGFTLVLAGLKTWLEHGIELNLVRDRHLPPA